MFRFFRSKRHGRLERKGIGAHKQRPKFFSQDTRSRLLLDWAAPAIAVAVVWCACALSVWYQPSHGSFRYVKNQYVTESVYAQVDFQYEDDRETDFLRKAAADKVLDVYRVDGSVSEAVRAQVQRLLARAAAADSGQEAAAEELDLTGRLLQGLTPAERDLLSVVCESEDKQRFLINSMNAMLADGIVTAADKERIADIYLFSDNVTVINGGGATVTVPIQQLWTPISAAHQVMRRYQERFPLSQSEQPTDLADAVFAKLLTANLFYDSVETDAVKAAAASKVEPVDRWVRKGTIFLRAGQTIAQEDLNKLAAHDEAFKATRDSRQYVLSLISMLILIGILVVLALVGLSVLNPELRQNPTKILLIALLVALNVAVIRGSELLLLALTDGAQVFVVPGLPLAMSAVLLALLISVRVGVSVGLFQALLVALISNDMLHLATLGIATATVGAIAVHHARTRTRTFRAAVAITGVAFAVECVHLLMYSTPAINYAMVFGVVAGSAFGTVLLVNVLLPPSEYIFGMTSNLSLFELSDLNHPLLRRLQMEAHGTYHHSLMVATLAETAAEAVGANTLLARVAAYFHDIGKLSNPHYFTENCQGVDNHADLSPRMSALVIINHVKEGLALAAKYKLKRPLRDAIATHHGTSIVSFFYQRARSLAADKTAVLEDDFRYPGPLPRDRVATIISLADSCEAASRSLEKPSPQKIEALVAEIFSSRLRDGQLSDSELTMQEIRIIETSICKSLSTMLHGRVAYPKEGANASNDLEAVTPLPAETPASAAASDQQGDQSDRPEPAVAGN